MRLRTRAVLLLLVAGGLFPTTASAFIDCCILHEIPTELRGVWLGQPAADVSEWLMGLGLSDHVIRPGESSGLSSTAFTWVPGALDASLGFASGGLRPVLTSSVLDCGPPFLKPPPLPPVTPVHARDLTRAIAVVADLAAETRRLREHRVGDMLLLSGAPGDVFAIPELEAIAVDLPLARGTIRLIQPVGSTGVVARALAEHGAHWWGFAVEVADAGLALRHLHSSGIAALERTEGSDRILTVLPSTPSMPAVELVHRWGAARP